ncbi:MAG: LytTR family DNA-binding domain-containing protein [Bacteroidota bacterium]
MKKAIQIIFWLAYLFLVISYLIEWLPKIGITSADQKDIVGYSVVYVLQFVFLVYFMAMVVVPRYNRAGKYIALVAIATTCVVLLSLSKMLLDVFFIARYLTPSSQPEWLFSIGHFLSSIPSLLLFLCLAFWLGALRQKKRGGAREEVTSKPEGEENEAAFLFLKCDKKLERITISDIQYIEGLKQYVKIFTPSRVYVALESMKNLEQKLTSHGFIRIHKSFIVSKHAIDGMSHSEITIGNKIIPIGRTYKEVTIKWKEQMLDIKS